MSDSKLNLIDDQEIKKAFYRDLAFVAPEKTIFTTNTSSLVPSQFAKETGRPKKFLALHFANRIWEANAGEIMGHPGTDRLRRPPQTGALRRHAALPVCPAPPVDPRGRVDRQGRQGTERRRRHRAVRAHRRVRGPRRRGDGPTSSEPGRLFQPAFRRHRRHGLAVI